MNFRPYLRYFRLIWVIFGKEGIQENLLNIYEFRKIRQIEIHTLHMNTNEFFTDIFTPLVHFG
jgi:hypothetical protein